MASRVPPVTLPTQFPVPTREYRRPIAYSLDPDTIAGMIAKLAWHIVLRIKDGVKQYPASATLLVALAIIYHLNKKPTATNHPKTH